MKFALDCSPRLGTYRVQCECGTTWNGQTQKYAVDAWSPALPIAECAVHLRLVHPDNLIDLRFSERFKAWLIEYWQVFNRVAETPLVFSTREVLR